MLKMVEKSNSAATVYDFFLLVFKVCQFVKFL